MRIKLFLFTLFLMSLTVSAQVSLIETKGWLEAAYTKFNFVDGADTYHVYSKEVGGAYTQLDKALVRNYGTYGRADVVGLKAGKYQLKIVPVTAEGVEMESMITETPEVDVLAHDRGGFAHLNHKGIGAYNDDGTLKSNAKVFYVSAANAKTITGRVIINSKGGDEEFTGIQAILNAKQKGYDLTPFAVRILGTLEEADMDPLESSAQGLQIKGNKAYSEVNITMEGIGDDAVIRGFGLLIRNCKSLELRNFAVMLAKDDAISLDTENGNCWVHHMDLFYGKTGSASDQAKGDGTLDVKANSQYMTFSYNRFWDSGKMSLCGMTSESGENFITYHHNWFDHSDSRHPRVRTMTVHVYNNYFDGVAKYGVGATMGSNVFVESNYYRNTNKPMLSSKQGTDTPTSSSPKGTFSGEDGGMIKAYGNIYAEQSKNFKLITHKDDAINFDCYEADTRNEQVPASYVTVFGGTTYNNFDTDPTKMYSYTPHAAADVPAVVTGEYGAGRIGHGDFDWKFDNAVDDASYDVNVPLKNAITNYKGELVGFFDKDALDGADGNGTGGGDGGDGGDSGDGGGAVTPPSNYDCFFTHSGKWSNSFYTVNGSTSNSKGSVTYGGTTYTDCLKIESSTNISFTIAEPKTLTLVFDEGKVPDIKINDITVNGTTSNVITYELPAGTHAITKAGTRNLFFMTMTPDASTGIEDSIYGDNEEDENAPVYDMSGRMVKDLQPNTLYIRNGKKFFIKK